MHGSRNPSCKAVLAGLICLLAGLPVRASDCGKVEDWVARAQAWSLGQDFNRMQSQLIRQRVVPVFHDEVMRQVWGSSFREMSDGARADIHSALTTCPVPPWVRLVMATPFSDPPELVKRSPGSDFQQWQLAIEAVNRIPYADWEQRRQQVTSGPQAAAQRRAERAMSAPAREQLAADIAAAQQQQREARARQSAQDAADRGAMVRHYRDGGPFSGSDGMAYLNALYLNDQPALLAFDRMFAAALLDSLSLYKGSAQEALVRLFQGPATAASLGEKQRKVAEHYSLAIPVAVAYVTYYEHAYPDCMDASPRTFERSIQHEWVTTNALGQVLKTSPAWTERQVFRINARFMEVWDRKGSIEQGNAIFTDAHFGRPGAIRVSDAMSAATATMHRFKCDSSEMQQFEKNLLTHFHDSIERMERAAR